MVCGKTSSISNSSAKELDPKWTSICARTNRIQVPSKLKFNLLQPFGSLQGGDIRGAQGPNANLSVDRPRSQSRSSNCLMPPG